MLIYSYQEKGAKNRMKMINFEENAKKIINIYSMC